MKHMASVPVLAPDVRPDGRLAGPIELGEVFAWEPWLPHANELTVVTRIEERPDGDLVIYSTQLDYVSEVWHEESVFRDACHRTLFRRFPVRKPRVGDVGVPLEWPTVSREA